MNKKEEIWSRDVCLDGITNPFLFWHIFVLTHSLTSLYQLSCSNKYHLQSSNYPSTTGFLPSLVFVCSSDRAQDLLVRIWYVKTIFNVFIISLKNVLTHSLSFGYRQARQNYKNHFIILWTYFQVSTLGFLGLNFSKNTPSWLVNEFWFAGFPERKSEIKPFISWTPKMHEKILHIIFVKSTMWFSWYFSWII